MWNSQITDKLKGLFFLLGQILLYQIVYHGELIPEVLCLAHKVRQPYFYVPDGIVAVRVGSDTADEELGDSLEKQPVFPNCSLMLPSGDVTEVFGVQDNRRPAAMNNRSLFTGKHF